MNGNVEIKGNVGAYIITKPGTSNQINITINNPSTEERPEALNHAVYRLLKTCDFHNIRPTMERIAAGLYGSCHFKSLSVEQVNKLQLVAMEIGGVMPATPAKPTGDFGFIFDGPVIGERTRRAVLEPFTESMHEW